jgi:membrane protein
MALKAVFLDIDGTLVDSNEFHVMAWQEAFLDSGHRLEKDAIRVQIGKGADQLIPDLLYGVAQGGRHIIAERHSELFRTRYLKQVKPFACARDLVEMLHAKGLVAILASSAEKAEVDYYVGLLKIADALSGAVSKDDVANSKPAGDIFAAALAKVFPLAASETLAIGDTPMTLRRHCAPRSRRLACALEGFRKRY